MEARRQGWRIQDWDPAQVGEKGDGAEVEEVLTSGDREDILRRMRRKSILAYAEVGEEQKGVWTEIPVEKPAGGGLFCS